MRHFISLEAAIALTTAYRKNREVILDPAYRNRNVLPLSETFDRAAFDAVLQQEGCEKLRIYFGMDEKQAVHAVIVGVNAKGEDMLPERSVSNKGLANSEGEDEGDDNNIIEVGIRCPPECPPPSGLNP